MEHANSTSILDHYEAVFAALREYRPGALVSIRKAVKEARGRLPPTSHITDDGLVDLLVKVATANQILVSFDQSDG